MSSHQGKRVVLSYLMVACLAGPAVAAQRLDPAPVPGSHQAALRDSPPAAVTQGGGTTSGVDPTIERGSRGVARNLLLAGIGVAAVIAVLSGVFALRHKKQ